MSQNAANGRLGLSLVQAGLDPNIARRLKKTAGVTRKETITLAHLATLDWWRITNTYWIGARAKEQIQKVASTHGITLPDGR